MAAACRLLLLPCHGCPNLPGEPSPKSCARREPPPGAAVAVPVAPALSCLSAASAVFLLAQSGFFFA